MKPSAIDSKKLKRPTNDPESELLQTPAGCREVTRVKTYAVSIGPQAGGFIEGLRASGLGGPTSWALEEFCN